MRAEFKGGGPADDIRRATARLPLVAGAGHHRAGGAVRSAGRDGTAHAPTHTLVIALM